MHNTSALLLMAIATGAFIMPYISRRFMLPVAVGEIAYGLILGLFFKTDPHEASLIRFLGELGFIVLMYLAGLEINFEKMRDTPKLDLWLYAAMFTIITALSFLTSHLLVQPPLFGLVYMTTAVGLLFPVLKELDILEHPYGQQLLIIGSIGEVFSLAGFTLLALYVRFGASLSSLYHLGQIAVFLLMAYAFHRLMDHLTWWHPKLIGPFLQTGNATETGVRANIANMFIFVALAALMDIEVIVGAFLGGLLFGMIFKEREAIMEKMGAFGYGFLVPIFFIEVGLRFNISQFLSFQVLRIAVLVSVIILLLRFLAVPLLLFTSMERKQVMGVPLAMSFPLTLLVAIATFAREGALISLDQAAGLLLAAILTALAYPLLFRVLLRGTDSRPMAVRPPRSD